MVTRLGRIKQKLPHRPQSIEAEGPLREKDPELPNPPTKDFGMSQPGKLSRAKCKQLFKGQAVPLTL